MSEHNQVELKTNKVIKLPYWVSTTGSMRKLIGDKYTDEFCKVLNLSKGKINNKYAVSLVQMGMKASDVVKYANFDVYFPRSLNPVTNSNKDDVIKKRGQYSKSQKKARKEIRFNAKRDAKFWEECVFGKKLVEYYGDDVRFFFGEELSHDSFSWTNRIGMTRMSQYNPNPDYTIGRVHSDVENIESLERDDEPAVVSLNCISGVSAHILVSILLSSPEKVKQLFKKQLCAEDVEEAEKVTTRLLGLCGPDKHSSNNYLKEDYINSEMYKDYRKWLEHDLSHMADMTDEQHEEFKRLSPPVINGRVREHRSKDTTGQTLSAFIYKYLSNISTQKLFYDNDYDKNRIKSNLDKFYQDYVPSLSCMQEFYIKHFVKPLYCNGIYAALDVLDAFIMLTGYDYRGSDRTLIINVANKLLQFYHKYTRIAPKLGNKTARDTIVMMFNEWAQSKAVGVYMVPNANTTLDDSNLVKKSKTVKKASAQPKIVKGVINGEEVEVFNFGSEGVC